MSKGFNEIELGELFQDEYRYALEKVNYSIEEGSEEIIPELLVNDYLSIDILDSSIIIHVSRSAVFDPASVFSANVGYAAELRFKDERAELIREHQGELEERFIKEGDFVFSNIMSRISLLLAQITASSGLQPLITPPSLCINID